MYRFHKLSQNSNELTLKDPNNNIINQCHPTYSNGRHASKYLISISQEKCRTC